VVSLTAEAKVLLVIVSCRLLAGCAVAQLVEALHYEPEFEGSIPYGVTEIIH
jgi:hypothetical protein